MLKKISLVLALAGMLFLLYLVHSVQPIAVNTANELSNLQPNQKVITTGKVVSERILYGTTKLLILGNKIEIVCDSCPAYSNRAIEVIGTTEKYQNKTQIKALRIRKLY